MDGEGSLEGREDKVRHLLQMQCFSPHCTESSSRRIDIEWSWPKTLEASQVDIWPMLIMIITMGDFSWLPNQMISLILIFGFLCRSSIIYFDTQMTEKYSTAMWWFGRQVRQKRRRGVSGIPWFGIVLLLADPGNCSGLPNSFSPLRI